MEPYQAAHQYWDWWRTQMSEYHLDKWCAEKQQRGYVYFLRSELYYKIGYSKNPIKRFPQIHLKLPFETRLWAIWVTSEMRNTEGYLHSFYGRFRTNGEWFLLPSIEAHTIQRMATSVIGPKDVRFFIRQLPQNLWGNWKECRDILSRALVEHNIQEGKTND